jgi:hypothetical protein
MTISVKKSSLATELSLQSTTKVRTERNSIDGGFYDTEIKGSGS